MSIGRLWDIFVPSADSSEEAKTLWRQLVGISITALIASVVCLYLITARASDLNDVKSTVLLPAIQGVHRQYCLEDDPATRRILEEKLIELERKYREATDSEFPRESCEDIRARLRRGD